MPALETSFTIDTSDFDKKFDLSTKEMEMLSIKGERRAAARLLRDAIQEEPRAPHKTGHLWRSGQITVPEEKGKTVIIYVGFNTKYAAYVHEMPETTNWTMIGSGPKFLSKKMYDNADVYFRIWADTIRNKGN